MTDLSALEDATESGCPLGCDNGLLRFTDGTTDACYACSSPKDVLRARQDEHLNELAELRAKLAEATAPQHQAFATLDALLEREREAGSQRIIACGDGGTACEETPGWECAARRATRGPNPPAECNWPVCGCDPYANKVIEALEESEAFPVCDPRRRTAWVADDGTRPSLICEQCSNLVPVLVHGKCQECIVENAAQGIVAATAGETEGLDERSEQSPVLEEDAPK